MQLVFSPHLDDAGFGCAALIEAQPPAVVVTVFAGRPPAGQPLTEWDARCGFRDGDDVVEVRRAEDRAALSRVGARPVWLDYLDAQYGARPRDTELADRLRDVLRRWPATTVAFPLGLFHEDHVQLHRVARSLAADPAPGRRWICYADALYRGSQSRVTQRLDELGAAGFAVRELADPPALPVDAKREVVGCYRSQLTGLSAVGHDLGDLTRPEQYWELAVAGHSR